MITTEKIFSMLYRQLKEDCTEDKIYTYIHTIKSPACIVPEFNTNVEVLPQAVCLSLKLSFLLFWYAKESQVVSSLHPKQHPSYITQRTVPCHSQPGLHDN
jgi:hypothetical protein